MPGYSNRVITLHFPELSEPDDDVHVVIRNPRLMPPDELRSGTGNVTSADIARLQAAQEAQDRGEEVPDDLVQNKDYDRGYGLVAKVIIGWHVYDATSTADDQPLLPLPATPELVAKLPLEILLKIMDEVRNANPPRTPATPPVTTGAS